MCFAVIENLNCKEEEEGKKKKTICDQSTSAGSYRACVCLCVCSNFFLSVSIFFCVCVVYCVCYISIICWWIQKSGIHVDGNFWIFFFVLFLTLRFYVYTVVQLLATLWFQSDPIRVRSGHYMPPTVSQPVSLVAFDCITKKLLYRHGKKKVE